MKTKLLTVFSLLVGFLGFSQTEVYFKYDEAGNQRYRGPNSAAKQVSEKKTELSKPPALARELPLMDEITFWKQIRLYPVPVNDFLTVDWTEEVNGLIESVSIYQHSTIHWKFQQQNTPDLNRQIKINMTGYEWGVYVLHFTLKDGRVFSRNITKR
ncbi:hypothetical protein C1631_014075 [Chryseobacterium phosphatilyticum]|uniref:Secretion system C-terminal sorting domain-containing protein n=1 Tax=Chryseobacterium phosphatilyticum TaxID=475075 RepID=A0A316X5T2_9FLAO|nr:hypothetical protein [Chryseobacterium phosphatilyticum]PWN69185.1 hypothetical protein C1631_014075 [Chryseobacterium phosphatilyticum]